MLFPKPRAQAGLEYLMTYGWALVMIATIVGALVFVFSPPSGASFSSSDPTKMLLKGGVASGGGAQIKLQNITGGLIKITSLSWDCTINGSAPISLDILAAGELLITCDNVIDAELAAGLVLGYNDASSLPRFVTISTNIASAGGAQYSQGSPGNPFEITTCLELQEIENNLDWYYILTGNIDCSETTTWNGGAGFLSISSFSGSLDAQGHTISGLYENRTRSGGLFASLSGVVKNLGLTGANITSTGIGEPGSALVGNNSGTISNCFSTGSVSSAGSVVGGLVSWNEGTISNSYSTASVTGVTVFPNSNWVGGLVGRNGFSGVITNSYSRGAVIGRSYVGGLVGANSGAVANSYSTGLVSATLMTRGGLVGTGTNCTSSFWDTQTSGQATSPCGTGKTTVLMQTQSTFTGWDFATVWQSPMSGYPALRQ